jgi:hypothetical protein
MAGQGRNYFANHVVAPQVLQGTPNYNVEVSEGINPPGEFLPAHYLPTVVSENRIGGSYYVLMSGKVVAMDSNGRLIPGGLGLDWAEGDGSGTILYGDNDVAAGFTNANGGRITSTDRVTDAMYDAGISVTDPVGIMRYSKLMAPGTRDLDPSSYWKHSYDTGGSAAFTRWGYIQVPIVETNTRQEFIQTNATDHRIQLYPNVSGLTFKVGSVEVTGLTQKQSPRDLTMGANFTEYAMVGRTIFMNSAAVATLNVNYAPQVDLPFTVLKDTVKTPSTTAAGVTTGGMGLSDLIGMQVTYDKGSDFKLLDSYVFASQTENMVGRILDIKEGSSADLKLVRTYFRDFGLWQEMPGSATDGRNAMLSIANAPKYIARIAVNFNIPLFQ